MTGLAERLVQTRIQISEECIRLQRSEPTLIVVTKNHSIDLAEQLYALGERDFGENRVQEALPKFQQFSESGTRHDAHWHLIGQLQTNKVKSALEFASSIHSLDRDSLLHELIKRTEARESALDVFIQVNLTSDPGRGGIELNEVLQFADQIVEAPKLNLKGLMAVASLDYSAERDFEIMAKLSGRLVTEHPQANSLSIGMSGDFLEALSYGATHLRIGTAITGNR
jgi:pyridoxal phosphate enzyme (YggS family)